MAIFCLSLCLEEIQLVEVCIICKVRTDCLKLSGDFILIHIGLMEVIHLLQTIVEELQF